MNAHTLAQVVTASGWECRVHREEVQLRTCYFCSNDKFNLELSADKGVYHCWVCGRGGRLDGLLKTLTGQEYHIAVTERSGPRTVVRPVAAAHQVPLAPLDTVPTALQYWESRGFTLSHATRYGVGICTDERHALYGRIVVPLRDYWTAAVVGYVGRSYTGRQPKYLTTLPVKMITGWRQRHQSTPAVVVEGPFDGLTVHEAGFSVAVLGGTGTAGIVDWAARLPAATPVAVLLDGDAQGKAEQLLWQLRPLRTSAPCVPVPLTADEDPNSIGAHVLSAKVWAALQAA